MRAAWLILGAALEQLRQSMLGFRAWAALAIAFVGLVLVAQASMVAVPVMGLALVVRWGKVEKCKNPLGPCED